MWGPQTRGLVHILSGLFTGVLVAAMIKWLVMLAMLLVAGRCIVLCHMP
jgi:hypothetical protein